MQAEERRLVEFEIQDFNTIYLFFQILESIQKWIYLRMANATLQCSHTQAHELFIVRLLFGTSSCGSTNFLLSGLDSISIRRHLQLPPHFKSSVHSAFDAHVPQDVVQMALCAAI